MNILRRLISLLIIVVLCSQNFFGINRVVANGGEINFSPININIQGTTPEWESDIDRVNQTVAVGIPIEDSSNITNIDGFYIIGANNNHYQVIETKRHFSGNISWILVSFQKDVLSKNKTNVTLEYDTTTSRVLGNNLATQTSELITINTGNGLFEIKKSNFELISRALVNGEELIDNSKNNGFVLTNKSGAIFTSKNDPNTNTYIEENGPVKTIIRSDGKLMNESGQSYGEYTIKMYFNKNNNKVKIDSYLKNSSYNSEEFTLFDLPYGKTYSALSMKSAGIEVGINSGYNNYSVLSGDSVINGSLSGEKLYITHGTHTDFMYTGHNNSSYVFNAPFPLKADSTESVGVAHDERYAGYKIGKGNTIIQDYSDMSTSTKGALSVNNGTTKISAYYRQFFGYNPGELAIDNGVLSLEVFGKNNPLTDPIKVNAVRYPAISHGKSIKRDFQLDFSDMTTNIKNDIIHLDYPLVGYTDLDQYGKTDAFYIENIPSVPEVKQWYSSDPIFEEARWGVYNYADPTDEVKGYFKDPKNATKEEVYRAWYWGNGGGINQTDFAANNYIDFFRTGRGIFYINALQRSYYNTIMGAGQNYKTLDNSRITGDFDAKFTHGTGFDNEHQHMTSMIYLYYLTGDSVVKDHIENFEEYIMNSSFYTNNMTILPTYGRSTSRLFKTASVLYDFTKNEDTYNKLKERLIFVLNTRDTPKVINTTKTYRGKEFILSKNGGFNLERGYLYQDITFIPEHYSYKWDNIKQAYDKNIIIESQKFERPFHSFFYITIMMEDLSIVKNILKRNNKDFKLQNDINDSLLGIAHFYDNEMFIDGGNGFRKFGNMYDHNLDNQYEYIDGNLVNKYNADSLTTEEKVNYIRPGLVQSDVSKLYNLLYKEYGDIRYLKNASRLTITATQYGKPARTYSDPGSLEMIYNYVNLTTNGASELNLSVINNNDGTYNLSWDKPAGDIEEYRIKYHPTKEIVDRLGYDPGNKTFTFDPNNYVNYFAADNLELQPEYTENTGRIETTITIPNWDNTKTYDFFAKSYPKFTSKGESGGEKINGSCGVDNGKILDNTPVNLCTYGADLNPFVTLDSGNNNWSWTCQGSNGGNNDYCSANKLIIQDDITAPLITKILPQETINSGTTSVDIVVNTNEKSTCKYSNQSNQAYGDLQDILNTNTDGLIHTINITGLINGNTYNYYIKCIDESGNTNNQDYELGFTIQQENIEETDTIAPIISNNTNSSFNYDNTQVNLSIITNEEATCKYSINSGFNFNTEINTLTSNTGSTIYNKLITGLTQSNTYNYYIKCKDNIGNINLTDFNVTFQIKDKPISSGGGGGGGSNKYTCDNGNKCNKSQYNIYLKKSKVIINTDTDKKENNYLYKAATLKIKNTIDSFIVKKGVQKNNDIIKLRDTFLIKLDTYNNNNNNNNNNNTERDEINNMYKELISIINEKQVIVADKKFKNKFTKKISEKLNIIIKNKGHSNNESTEFYKTRLLNNLDILITIQSNKNHNRDFTKKLRKNTREIYKKFIYTLK